MIKVTMIVKRHEDRYEVEFTFDSSESGPENCRLMADFLRKKVAGGEAGTRVPGERCDDRGQRLASRYRENIIDRDGVVRCQCRMDFHSRRDIVRALRMGKRNPFQDYNGSFEKAARSYFDEYFSGREDEKEEELRLVEPQKAIPLRSAKVKGIIVTLVLTAVSFMDSFGKFWDDWKAYLAVTVVVLLFFQLVEWIFGQPGGMRVRDLRRDE